VVLELDKYIYSRTLSYCPPVWLANAGIYLLSPFSKEEQTDFSPVSRFTSAGICSLMFGIFILFVQNILKE
jgi:hypothetical protein